MLNAARLSAAIEAALEIAFSNPALSMPPGPNRTLFCTAIASAVAGAVVAEITGNAVVPALGLVSPSGNVTGAAVVT